MSKGNFNNFSLPLKIKGIRKMKGFFKVFLVVFIFMFSVALFSSCSNKSVTHKHKVKHGQQVRVSPTTSKSAPISKKFFIKSKKRSILGQKKPI